ncbi:MAG: metalloregulator ArsR/SmtB family transcription factor [Pyrinomonadaceae bacterium]|nr:metalloregulator ArsR/SmtB family transcription factor [Pyrinomonadaceae bacterium]
MDKNMSPQAIEMIADRFRVLSESIRLRLVNELRDGEMSVSELTAKLQASQPNVSKHLKLLTDSGILRREQRGNTVLYSIADDSIFKLCDVVCDSLGERLKEQANLFVFA